MTKKKWQVISFHAGQNLNYLNHFLSEIVSSKGTIYSLNVFCNNVILKDKLQVYCF